MSNSLSLEGSEMYPEELEFVVGSCRFKMIKVEGGTFTMGATEEQGADASDDERPTHKVGLSDYYIGQTEVTQALWEAIMGENRNQSRHKGDNLPESVGRNGCQDFIQKLNRLFSNQLGGNRFALPTEAQWEFAARGGNKSKGYKYAGSNNIDEVAWYEDNSGREMHPVAQKQPNELGLYDMSGNVGEWCQDLYDRYSSNAQINPKGPSAGVRFVIRGGNCKSRARNCRVSDRSDCSPVGFRLCLIVKVNNNLKCSKCGFENPDSFKFCGQCGAKLKVINKCHNCGTTLPSYGIFCPECGTRIYDEPIDTDDASGIDTYPKELEYVVGSCRFKMIKVDGGTFTMGATAEQGDDASDDERPTHKVTLSYYYIGQTEVTQALWEAVMGNNPSEFKGDNLPVEQVSWDDCQSFFKKLNSLLSKHLGGMRFALPTEAQWEFAARGGNKSKGYKYAGSNNIDEVAWYCHKSSKRPHCVAQKQPNELGLYDMSGNVGEWCQDWYGGYRSNPQTNPQGPARGVRYVIRGGGCQCSAEYCRVSNRIFSEPYNNSGSLGLRLCLLP